MAMNKGEYVEGSGRIDRGSKESESGHQAGRKQSEEWMIETVPVPLNFAYSPHSHSPRSSSFFWRLFDAKRFDFDPNNNWLFSRIHEFMLSLHEMMRAFEDELEMR